MKNISAYLLFFLTIAGNIANAQIQRDDIISLFTYTQTSVEQIQSIRIEEGIFLKGGEIQYNYKEYLRKTQSGNTFSITLNERGLIIKEINIDLIIEQVTFIAFTSIKKAIVKDKKLTLTLL